MSGILNLAQSFQTKSEQKAASIGVELENEYQKHAESIRRILSESESTLRADILESQKRLRATALSSWKWISITLLAVGLSIAAALGVTGWMIGDNIQKISLQRQTLQNLEAQGVQTWSEADRLTLRAPKGWLIETPFLDKKTGQWVVMMGTKKKLESK